MRSWLPDVAADGTKQREGQKIKKTGGQDEGSAMAAERNAIPDAAKACLPSWETAVRDGEAKKKEKKKEKVRGCRAGARVVSGAFTANAPGCLVSHRPRK